jgi:hypothetical protein
MKTPIRKAPTGGKTIYLENVGVWYDAPNGQIHMTVPGSGWFHTTVSDNPDSARGHRNLFAKLARALKEAGAPHPDFDESEAAKAPPEVS